MRYFIDMNKENSKLEGIVSFWDVLEKLMAENP